MNPTISIIVPVYNVERYLPKCIDSLLRQTFTDFEVLLVDDGSMDLSGDICDRYAVVDARISVIHTENGGLARARNMALDQARGEYIAPIDSDDWVDDDYLEVLLNACREYDADVASCDCYFASSDGQQNRGIYTQSALLERTEAFKAILEEGIFPGYSACKIFRRSLFDGIRFPAGRIFEDTATIYLVIYRATRVVHIGASKYYYRLRADSLSRGKNPPKFYHWLLALLEQLEFVQEKSPEFVDICLHKIADWLVRYYNQHLLKPDTDYDEYWDEILYRIKPISSQISECLVINHKLKQNVLLLLENKRKYSFLFHISQPGQQIKIKLYKYIHRLYSAITHRIAILRSLSINVIGE